MPLLALPLFWVLPMAVAVPSYAAIVGVSGWSYWLAIRVMRRPIVSGREELLGSVGEVVDVGRDRLSVRVHGEVWTATSADKLRMGERVRVTRIDGLVLAVSPLDPPKERPADPRD
jgi:membrane-bound serine protease (ClpP class)